MKFKTYLLLILLIPFLGCNNNKKGYSDLDKLYAEFVDHLNDPNEEKLKAYCYKITPDKGTVAYMKKNNFSYRGIPEELEKRNMKPSEIGDKYYEVVSKFKKSLKQKNQLDDLKYVGREQEGEELYNEKLKIYVTETFILLESNGDPVRCKLGEMFKINGTWKSFTSPKLGW